MARKLLIDEKRILHDSMAHWGQQNANTGIYTVTSQRFAEEAAEKNIDEDVEVLGNAVAEAILNCGAVTLVSYPIETFKEYFNEVAERMKA